MDKFYSLFNLFKQGQAVADPKAGRTGRSPLLLFLG